MLYCTRKVGEVLWTLREWALQLERRDVCIVPPPRTEHSAWWVLGPESWGNPEQPKRGGATWRESSRAGTNSWPWGHLSALGLCPGSRERNTPSKNMQDWGTKNDFFLEPQPSLSMKKAFSLQRAWKASSLKTLDSPWSGAWWAPSYSICPALHSRWISEVISIILGLSFLL